MKKFLSIFMSTLLIAFSCISALAVEDNKEFCVKIVHTNDIHARVTESDYDGIIGMPKLKTLIDNHIQNSDMSFVLDSGDIFHGQSIATLVEGESIAELIGACGYDAMTAGNHDWNYGKDRLKELVNITDENNSNDFYMLTGNVINNDGSEFFDDEFLIKTIEKNGEELKVGVFGVIDPNIYNATAPSNVSGLVFTDMEDYSETAVEYLQSQDCQLIIGLTHSINPAVLASNVDGVDLWLAGHEHMDINEIVTTPNGEETLIIENGYYLYEAGLIEIDFDLNSSNEVENLEYKTSSVDYSASTNVAADANVQSVLDNIVSEQNQILEQVVGTSPAELDGVWEHLRIYETNLGRALTDSYLFETGADVAFENAGGIRASISQGDVTYGDILNVLPYGNYIVTKQVTGDELLAILETSIDIQIKNIEANNSGIYDAWPANSGSYLQVGGMTVKYDTKKDKGQRIISALVGGDNIDKDTFYIVATNNYTAVSTDYPQLASKEIKGEFSACDEALIQFFKQSDEYILSSISTERMINTTDKPVTPDETSSTDVTTESQASVPATVSTASTDSTSSTKPSASTLDLSGNVATGDGLTVFGIIAIVFVSAVCIYTFYRKKKIN